MQVTVRTDNKQRGYLVDSGQRALLLGFRAGLDRRPAITMPGRTWVPIPSLFGGPEHIEPAEHTYDRHGELALELAAIYGVCSARFGDAFWSMLLPPADSNAFPAARLIGEHCVPAVGHRTAPRGIFGCPEAFFSMDPVEPVATFDIDLNDPARLRRSALELSV